MLYVRSESDTGETVDLLGVVTEHGSQLTGLNGMSISSSPIEQLNKLKKKHTLCSSLSKYSTSCLRIARNERDLSLLVSSAAD